jgi:uncharacterized membrane protein (UPF0127 family)
MKSVAINNITHPLGNHLQVEVCQSFGRKLRGLMFHSRLAMDQGLLLVEKRDSRMDASIHMFFVFMDLGVVWLDASLHVVDAVRARAWHPAYIPSQPARYILEIHPERLAEFKISDQVAFHEA